jgi:isopenicillin-N N-acyltransferase-like protein
VVRRAAAQPFEADLVSAYRAVTIEHLPWLVEELDAVAETAGVSPLAVFAASVEELAAAPVPARCTDLVAAPPRSDHVVVAHNNDLSAEQEADVVAIEWRVPGEPVVFTLGIGPWISVGWNDAGLSVTGNELAPNDERVGIPRLLQVRDVLTRRTLAEAVEAVLHPARASSYHWVLAHASGDVVNIEGSATSASVTRPEGGVLAHTNHYVDPDMLAFERSAERDDSASRFRRAAELLAAGVAPEEALRDHANAPSSICKHGDEQGTKTVFWCVADVTACEIVFGRGNPCRSPTQTYSFER